MLCFEGDYLSELGFPVRDMKRLPDLVGCSSDGEASTSAGCGGGD